MVSCMSVFPVGKMDVHGMKERKSSMETIIASVISGMVGMLVCMINNRYQQKARDEQHNKTIALMEYKLDELTRQVYKYNNVIERVYALEQHEAVIEEKLKVTNSRIDDLKTNPHN